MGLSWQQGPLSPGAWKHVDLPAYVSRARVTSRIRVARHGRLLRRDERIVGHAADGYHRIEIRQASRALLVRHRNRVIANTRRPLVLYESGFAPRWYVSRADLVSFEPDVVSVQLDGTLLRLEPGQTVFPHGPDRELTVAEALPVASRAMSEHPTGDAQRPHSA